MSRVRVPSIAHFFRRAVNLFQALLLGIVQGATEFFPVSSSGHLRICKKLLGIEGGESLLYFDLLCHAGTLLALIWYLRKEVWQVLKSPSQIFSFTLALLPLVPGYFLLKPARIALSDPSFLGYFLLCTAGLLFWAERLPVLAGAGPVAMAPPKKWQNMLWIGAMQTLALIPGISRSGSTIAAARACGWSWKEAAKFSFLLAIPTVLGGEVLETLKWLRGGETAYASVPLACYGLGFAASFGVGLFSVRAVFWIYEKGKVLPFAWYCASVGALAFVMFHG